MQNQAEFKPYVASETSMREMTVLSLVVGCVLGIVFAASSMYLVLKVGMTVSASIPIAVLSITLFRVFGKVFSYRATILENNIVQTAGSAGESIAFGIGITMPALLLMGMEMELVRVLLVALLGGILGVLMMIPLRDSLIVREHGKLAYPEGTACADVLIVGEQGGTNAKMVFVGLFLGAIYKFAQAGLKLFKEIPEHIFKNFKGGSISAEISPELLGVGYIIGPRISGIMMAGGIFSYLVLIPAIAIFGEGLTTTIFPARKLISAMNPNEIRGNYILYIAAGAVAAGGLISLVRSLPTIWQTFRRGFSSFKKSGQGQMTTKRTERDLPMAVVLVGSLVLLLAIWIEPVLQINFVSALLILVFGFFFVTVSSRVVGEIGSSSNPISGMTVATLLLTCLLFLAVGWTGVGYRAIALSTAALVCVAAANAGATSQNLKTGYLIGATPRLQQIAIMFGVITSAVVIGYTVIAMNNSKTTIVKRDFPSYTAQLAMSGGSTMKAPDGNQYRILYINEQTGDIPTGKYLVGANNKINYLVDPGICGVVTEDDNGKPVTKFDSPKSRLFSLIIDGILTHKLPWGLVLIGIMLAIGMEFCGVASLPFAVGLYLPVSTSAAIMGGGAVRYLVDRKKKMSDAESEFSPGVLMSSGLIAGGALMGVALAIIFGSAGEESISMAHYLGKFANNQMIALGLFTAMAVWLYRVGVKSESGK